MDMNQQVILAQRPQGPVTTDDFRLMQSAVRQPDAGEILIRNHWLSLDPYMRSRISAAKSYAQGVEPGQIMVGATVGQVLKSESPDYQVGDWVLSASGWQTQPTLAAESVSKLDDEAGVSLSAYLGVAGMPGITAWTGLMTICEPKAGETVVVDAASGAVGSVVGQLAKGLGCRVVGIAGGPQKCAYVVEELGFDACVDHRSETFTQDLEQALPDGIDCLFENVGGEIFETLLGHMNTFGRVALCGMISELNDRPHHFRGLRPLLVQRLKVQGFIVSDRMETWPEIRKTLIQKVASGELRYRESIADGIENAPQAFVGLLNGRNFGKQLVRLV